MFCKKTPISKSMDELSALCGQLGKWMQESRLTRSAPDMLPTLEIHSGALGSDGMKSALMPAESKQYTLFPYSLFNLLCRYVSAGARGKIQFLTLSSPLIAEINSNHMVAIV